MTGRCVLVVGCGYLGRVVAEHLAGQGAVVIGWVRTRESAATLSCAFEQVVVGDVAAPDDWGQLGRIPDLVVHAAASGGGGPEAYAQVYRQGVRQIVRQLPRARLLFVSSTSVYGQNNGEWVTEADPAEPDTETGRILREAETLALAAGGAVLRAVGIYGPGRGILWKRFVEGTAMVEGEGGRWINHIHRDDLAAAVIHVLGREAAEIYNVVDDEPVRQIDFYRWCAERTGRPLPPSGVAETGRKRGVTNKRVANTKLRGIGWVPRFPTFREGLAEEVAGVTGA